MKRIKIVQIGAMHDHSAPIFTSLKKLEDVFEVTGLAIPDGERVLNEQVYTGVRRLSVEEALSVPGLEAVTIETSEKNLTKYATLAAKRGIAIHMDKPGGLLLTDFEKLISIVKENKIVFHTGYMYRYNSAVQNILTDVRNGKYGEIYSVEAHMDCCHTPEKRQWLSQFPGGMTFYLGCHLIDLILQLQGVPKEILPLNCSTGLDGVTADDYGMAVFKYKNGNSFFKTCAAEPGGYMRRQLVVCGSKGTVQLLPFEAYGSADSSDVIYTGVRSIGENLYDWSNNGENYCTEPQDRYCGMLRAFAEYVSGIKANPYTPEYELELYKIILKCCGSK